MRGNKGLGWSHTFSLSPNPDVRPKPFYVATPALRLLFCCLVFQFQRDLYKGEERPGMYQRGSISDPPTL